MASSLFCIFNFNCSILLLVIDAAGESELVVETVVEDEFEVGFSFLVERKEESELVVETVVEDEFEAGPSPLAGRKEDGCNVCGSFPFSFSCSFSFSCNRSRSAAISDANFFVNYIKIIT
jgi:hypothetical protein